MQQVSLEHFCDVLEHMTINHSTDSGFAVTHVGHIDGVRTIAVSTCRGAGDCFIIQ